MRDEEGDVDKRQGPLYGRDEADAMRGRDDYWAAENRAKWDLLLDNLGPCERLFDLGCGWGQFLREARGRVPELWGADESPDRLSDIKEACPEANVVTCRADKLDLPDGHFDVVVTSQILHEVVLFGTDKETEAVLSEIRRVLKDGGRWLLLDHLDPGPGQATVTLPPRAIEMLLEFERRFAAYRAVHRDIEDCGAVELPRRCLQDFLTKLWARGSAMEEMEMRETHCIFRRWETIAQAERAGFRVDRWILFSDIRADLERVGGKLVGSRPWFRKFLMAATKA
jgi:ubiquinone/menaquinone biosynthesis C-methylase UbiE